MPTNLTAPPIDRREQEQLAAQLREYIARYVEEYANTAAVQNDTNLDTIVQLFARLHEIIGDRINRAPDRNFLTFLELVGVDISAPQPASAPLVFVPDDRGTSDVVIPAGTPVIVEGTEDDPIAFETREALSVVRANFERVVSIDPIADRFTDHASLLDENTNVVETLLAGRTPLTHRIYIGHDELFDLQDTATLRIQTEQPVSYGFTPDRWAVKWYKYNSGGELEALTPLTDESPTQKRVNNLLEGGSVVFEKVESIEAAPISGYRRREAGESEWSLLEANKRWIVAELSTSIPAETYTKAVGLQPDFIFLGEGANLSGTVFDPLGDAPANDTRLVFGDRDILSNTGATIELNFELADPPAELAGGGITISWQFLNEQNQWERFGELSPMGITSNDSINLVDTTDFFRKSGSIRFYCPEIPIQIFNDKQSRWIRAKVQSGGYDVGKAPVGVRFDMGHSYVPELISLTAEIDIRPDAAKQPSFAFFNAQTLDISKDFFPFGERPDFNDTFYFALKDAFSNAGSAVELQFELSAGAPAPNTTDITLVYEYFNGSVWREIGTATEAGVATPTGACDFTDSTNAFKQNGTVRFVAPDISQAIVNGREDFFLRVRILGGDYGREAFFDNSNQTLVPASFAPPSIASFLIGYTFLSTAVPEQLVLENEFFFEDSTAAFTSDSSGAGQPSGKGALSAPTNSGSAVDPVAVFQTSQDSKPALYLGFDRALDSVPVSLFFPLQSAPFQLTEEGEPPTILWEYWNGSEWKVATFNDATISLTRKDLAQVLVPGDSTARPVFGSLSNWVRLRLESGAFVTRPELSALYINAVDSSNVITVRDELLGSSNAEPSQKFRIARAPVISGQQIAVREVALTAEDRAAVIAEEGGDAVREEFDEDGNLVATWVRYHPVVRFEASGPNSRHYIFNSLNGEVLFGNGERGYIPPAGRNNIVAEFYQFGGGERGNVAPRRIVRPRRAIAGLSEVFNPEQVSGGVDLESLDRLRKRGPRAIKNRGRAVTLDDFEALTIDSTAEVARVKALAATNPALRFDPGWITLLIVPQSDSPRPIPSQELIRFVTNYLRERSLTNVAGTVPSQINVIPPSFLRVFAEVDVAYENINEAKIVQDRIDVALTEFFNPLRGGPKGTGWEFGRNVFGTEVYKVIEDVEGVDFVSRVILRASEQILYVFARTPFLPQAGYPAGSEIEFSRVTPTGPRRSVYRTGEKLVGGETASRVTVLGVKEGDVITLRTGATMNNFPINLVVESVEKDLIRVNPDFATATYPVGSVIESIDGRVRIALLEEVPVGEILSLRVMTPETGDSFLLRSGNLAEISGKLASATDEVEVIILDENNLTYSGTHVIRALQQA